MLRFILMDIEGTTTSISFVHETLFPYAAAHLADYVKKHAGQPEVRQELEAVRQTVQEEEDQIIDDRGAVDQLLKWISEDRKHTALKTLQGYIWKDGYVTGQYRGHLYPDVLPCWKRWTEQGLKLGIYSSGSVEAQKLLFGYSVEGDLTPYLSAYFDTKVGHKRETASYEKISAALGIPPAGILFLSDVVAELDAAAEAGLQTAQSVRPGIPPGEGHPRISDFTELQLDQ